MTELPPGVRSVHRTIQTSSSAPADHRTTIVTVSANLDHTAFAPVIASRASLRPGKGFAAQALTVIDTFMSADPSAGDPRDYRSRTVSVSGRWLLASGALVKTRSMSVTRQFFAHMDYLPSDAPLSDLPKDLAALVETLAGPYVAPAPAPAPAPSGDLPA